MLQLVYVGVYSGDKHKHYYADFGGLHKKIGLVKKSHAARTENYSGKKCADYLRKMNVCRHKPENFCKEQYKGKRQQKII